MYMCLALLNTFYALWCKDITNAGMEYAMDGADRDFDLYEVQSDGGGKFGGDPVEVLFYMTGY